MKEFISHKCQHCLQERDYKNFSIWIEVPTKLMKCDFCHDPEFFDKIMENGRVEREAKKERENKKLTQQQIDSVKSKSSMSKLAVRRAIELRNEKKLIEDETGL